MVPTFREGHPPIIHAIRKLPHYFRAHTVAILTQLPLQALLCKLDFIGRVAKWGNILGFFDIKYLLQKSIKGQVSTRIGGKIH